MKISRRAISLIEMSAVIAIGTTLMAVATLSLHALMRTEGSVEDAVRRAGVVGRLADQFRHDAHAAIDLETLPENKGWRFDLAEGRTVLYEPETGGLARIETVDAQVKRRESYVLPPDHAATIEGEDDAEVHMVSLRLAPIGEAAQRLPKLPSRIDAVLGRDYRFVLADTTEGASP